MDSAEKKNDIFGMFLSDKVYGEERALYALTNAVVENCTFAGEQDGESALKETRNICVRGCRFELRYPLWHCHGFTVERSTMSETCRASLWYSCDGNLSDVSIQGVKALRECDRICLDRVTAVSAEFGWNCRTLHIADSVLTSEYAFKDSSDLTICRFRLTGKYSFQYVRNVSVADSFMKTKDAFWHAKNAVIENSAIDGEYFGWYSENVTLKNCRISGTQPFCYCKGLKLINCTLENCDFAFENSEVEATVNGNILSVKTPRSGYIIADSIGEILLDGGLYPVECNITVRNSSYKKSSEVDL